jgi:hypothetical protein
MSNQIDRRRKNGNWMLNPDARGCVTTQDAQLAVLMDIRDELQRINQFLGCYRIPKALDAAIELGAEARRRKRQAADRRKNARRTKG